MSRGNNRLLRGIAALAVSGGTAALVFPVKHDILRATFLMHYGDPHGGSLALGAIKQLNLRRVRRTRERVAA